MRNASVPEVVRVILADDHDLVRSGIKALLSGIPGVQVIAEARDGAELIALAESLESDIVMTDIEMPGVDGLAAIARLHRSRPAIRLLALSMHNEVDIIKQAIAVGACGYVMKDSRAAELEQAVQRVIATGHYFSSAIALRLLQKPEPAVADELTQRQIEILALVAQGHASKEIAFRLGLSSKTVDAHKARIMERLGLHDIATLTLYAARKGLVRS